MTGPPHVIFRAEEPHERAAVHDVVDNAFGAHGHAGVGDLVDALRMSADWVEGLSFVAVEHDRVVGHVLFTRSFLDTPTRLIDVLQLSPLSVTPDRQGGGIGSALVRHALEVLGRADGPGAAFPLVFLEGSPHYYSRFGFLTAGPLGFRRPSLRIPPAAFQVYPRAGYQPWMTGTVVYSDAFWRHDSVGLRDTEGSVWSD